MWNKLLLLKYLALHKKKKFYSGRTEGEIMIIYSLQHNISVIYMKLMILLYYYTLLYIR